MKRSLLSSAISRNEFGICIYEGGSLLIAGGDGDKREATDNCFVFNTKTKAIRYIGSLNTKRSGSVLVSFKGEVFCIGGHNGINGMLNSIEVFDATTEKWKYTKFDFIRI